MQRRPRQTLPRACTTSWPVCPRLVPVPPKEVGTFYPAEAWHLSRRNPVKPPREPGTAEVRSGFRGRPCQTLPPGSFWGPCHPPLGCTLHVGRGQAHLVPGAPQLPARAARDGRWQTCSVNESVSDGETGTKNELLPLSRRADPGLESSAFISQTQQLRPGSGRAFPACRGLSPAGAPWPPSHPCGAGGPALIPPPHPRRELVTVVEGLAQGPCGTRQG